MHYEGYPDENSPFIDPNHFLIEVIKHEPYDRGQDTGYHTEGNEPASPLSLLFCLAKFIIFSATPDKSYKKEESYKKGYYR